MNIQDKVKINKPITFDELLAHELKDPDFRKDWEADSSNRELGKQIINARIESKLSQRDLAKRANTTQAVISRIESMSVSPSIQLVDRIARAFGKTLLIKFV